MSLSSGMLVAFYFILLDDKYVIKSDEKVFIKIAIISFCVSIFSSMQVVQWEADRDYILASIFDEAKGKDKENNLFKKRRIEKYQLYEKRVVRCFFLLGVICIGLFLLKRT